MPAAPFPRLVDSELDAVTSWIETAFARQDDAAPPEPGRVTARRLNRTEYDNTVRDLLGVDIGAAEDFPPDDSGYGFDNIGDVLSLSPALMERYMATAEKRGARRDLRPVESEPTLTRHPPIGRKIRNSTTPLLDYDTTGLSLPNALHLHQALSGRGRVSDPRRPSAAQRPAGSASVYRRAVARRPARRGAGAGPGQDGVVLGATATTSPA